MDKIFSNMDVLRVLLALWKLVVNWLTFFNLDLLHARLNNHYDAIATRKRSTKRLKHAGNLFRNNLQLKGVS